MTHLFQSPAKLNLFLQVTGKRPDGYHELYSFFHTINFFDTLSFKISDTLSLTSTHKTLPLDETNLILKAYHLFKKTQKNFPFFSIHLIKNIPMEGGLGGGSSNAATTLWALNTFAEKKLSIEELSFLGKHLGADVPFFFSEGAALVEGIGECIQKVPPLKEEPFTLFYPPFGLSTPQVFAHVLKEEVENKQKWNEKNFLFHNSVEKAAFRVNPALKNWKETLEEQIHCPLYMTGTGSTFFTPGHRETNLPSLKVHLIGRSAHSWY